MASQHSGPPYTATCACGKTKLKVNGKPMLQTWCHCWDCRSFNQSLATSIVAFPEGSVTVVEGKDHLGKYLREGTALTRCFCKANCQAVT